MSEDLSRERGAALVELAVVLPVLLLFALGAADFARFYYYGMQLTVGAREGAQYGALNEGNAGDTGTTGTMATTAIGATNLSSLVTADAVKFYLCLDNTTGAGGTETTCTPTCTNTCSAGQHQAVYVRVTTTASFRPISRYLGVPASISMSRKATQRVPE